MAGILLLLSVVAPSCKKKGSDQDVKFVAPASFPQPVYNMAANPLTQSGFVLGRKLFYDPRLSRDNTIACGNCHQQFASFVHAGHTVSHGIDNKLGHRNTPALVNLAWSYDFFWDGGVHDLDLVPPNPIKNPVEMDAQLPDVLDKLRNDSKYPGMFKAAFGTDEINTTRFLQALSQFMYALVSANSRYDRYVRGETQLSSDEMAGLALFQQRCSTCHATDLFTDRSYHNNGIQTGISDSGRYNVTLDPADIGRFKTPTLRNIEKTSPYMHNGSLHTLEDVLDFYGASVHYSPTLDTVLQRGGTTGITLSADDKVKIIAFLKTLTDDDFLKDPRFSEQ
ncbi:MAG: cytochrome-c peroxidase [Bacteroidetes bacterium]|nr:cytochrome-c peroxidase [Bacteroidota bacterium]